MLEYIQDAGLKPARAYTKRSKTNLIVLHHVQGSMSVKQVHQLHLARGHKGIDYNIYIDRSGQIYWGRGLEYEGGHTLNSGVSAGVNARSVGIVCNGDYTKETMPPAQLAALKRVTLDVSKHYGLTVDQIKAHREVGNTDCPGKNFPVNGVREYVKEQLTGGKSGMYVTTRTAEIYRRDSDRKSIGADNEVELQEYSGGKWALVKNPKTGNEFIIEFAALRQK